MVNIFVLEWMHLLHVKISCLFKIMCMLLVKYVASNTKINVGGNNCRKLKESFVNQTHLSLHKIARWVEGCSNAFIQLENLTIWEFENLSRMLHDFVEWIGVFQNPKKLKAKLGFGSMNLKPDKPSYTAFETSWEPTSYLWKFISFHTYTKILNDLSKSIYWEFTLHVITRSWTQGLCGNWATI